MKRSPHVVLASEAGDRGHRDSQVADRMRIREAAEADLEQVLAIERQSFLHPWSEPFFSRLLREAIFMVCEEEREVVGFLVGELDSLPGQKGPSGHLLNLAVSPHYRRKGVGTRLLEAFLRLCHQAGSTNVYLEVRVGNTLAVQFYHRRGFKTACRIPHFYGDGEDAYLMESKL